MTQVILSKTEYDELVSKARLFENIINQCSKDGVLYAKELENYTEHIAKYMEYNHPNIVGWYHNCKINYTDNLK